MNEPKRPDTWEIIPLEEYRLPSIPAGSAMANLWEGITTLFDRSKADSQAPFKEETKLTSLSEVQMEHVMQALDPQEGEAALDAYLDPQLQDVRFFADQPFGPLGKMLELWGDKHGARRIEPPTREMILGEDMSWFEAWPGDDTLWILPELERCYLRHAHGLHLIRELLRRLAEGSLGHGVICCDSWALAYLKRAVLPLAASDILTFQAFDGERLSRILSQLARSHEYKQLHFKNAATGEKILCVPKEQEGVKNEIRELAAHCRGNVVTALAYWRERLRSEPDEDDTRPTNDSEETDIWISADFHEPALPVELEEDTVFVLHALLLHGRLNREVLAMLMPFDAYRCDAVLYRLKRARIIEVHGGEWRVAKLAYAQVRRHLAKLEYLVDDF